MKINRWPILGVMVSAQTYSKALKIIKNWIENNQQEYICVSALHLIMECQKDEYLKKGVNKAGMVTSDGMPLVWILKKHFPKARRVYGPDLTWKISELAAKNGYGIFYLGGASGESKLVGQKIKEKYTNLIISGCLDTPIRPIPDKENGKIIRIINNSKAKIVVVGLGCPLQEKWMIENRRKLKANVLIGVGAAFDFITNREKQAPRWLGNMGGEWLFRWISEPRRLTRRYLKIIWFILKYKVNHIFQAME